MASPVSIGDVVTMVSGAISLYRRLKEAPDEILFAKNDLEHMSTTLRVLQESMEDETSFIARDKQVAARIQDVLKRVQIHTKQMDDVLRKFSDPRKMKMADVMRYAALDKSRLQKVRDDFRADRSCLESMIKVQEVGVFNELRRNGDELRRNGDELRRNDAKLEQRMEELFRQQMEADKAREKKEKAREKKEKAREKAEEAREKARQEERLEYRKIIEAALKKLQARTPSFQDVEQITEKESVVVLDQLESELRKTGLPAEKAKSVRFDTSQVLFRQRRVSKEREIKKDNPILSADNMDLAEYVDPEYCRILCVDYSHGLRARLAHLYLEIWRARQAACSGRWLFHKVDSAGVNPEGGPESAGGVNTDGIKMLGAKFKSTVMDVEMMEERILQYEKSKFTVEDFQAYDYILLCGPEEEKVTAMWYEAQQRLKGSRLATIIGLEKRRNISTKSCVKDRNLLNQVVENVGAEIFSLMTGDPWRYSYPSAKAGCNAEVVQFVAHYDDIRYQSVKAYTTFEGQALKDVEKEAKCYIKIVTYRCEKRKVLVSIVGRPERLASAKSMIVKA